MKTPGSLDGNDHCFRERAPARGCGGVPPRPVVDPAGRVWPSLSAAARAYRLTVPGLRHRVENRLGGWRPAPPPRGAGR